MNEIQQFASKKIYLKMVYVKWRPFFSGVNVFEMSRSEQNGHSFADDILNAFQFL